MNYQTICDIIFKLYLYGDAFKMIHYCKELDSGFAHRKCDEIRDAINYYADTLAETYFGYAGRPNFSQLSIKQDINTTDDPGKLCGNVINLAESIRDYANKEKQLSSIVSDTDTFLSSLQKYTFLFTFDKVSKFKTQNA